MARQIVASSAGAPRRVVRHACVAPAYGSADLTHPCRPRDADLV